MFNSIKKLSAAVAEMVLASINRTPEVYKKIAESLEMSEKTKSLLCTLASKTPTEPPVKPGGGEMTICELYPDLAPQEIDYFLTLYKGHMERGNNGK